MKQTYARFFAAFNQLPYDGDREEFRHELVYEFTDGRTSSLREMTHREYDALCSRLERLTTKTDEMRRRRSVCLRLMQELGVNTSDWQAVNSLCLDSRIAGKAFYKLGCDELVALSVKLRAIKRNGGLKPLRQAAAPKVAVVVPVSSNVMLN